MASVISLGSHQPTGLSYLVAEGILPSDPAEDLYHWQTISQGQGHGSSDEEELINTKYCVIWSKRGVIQRVFRFEIEGEAVTQAILTRFDYPSARKDTHRRVNSVEPHNLRSLSSGTNLAYNVQANKFTTTARTNSETLLLGTPQNSLNQHEKYEDRALVVVLKTQAHVYYLSGPSHIVHLPFEVEAAFPLPHGVILQRKLTPKTSLAPTPMLPSVPANSFAFSQFGSSQSQSQADATNVRNAFHTASSVETLLDKLIKETSSSSSHDLPRLFYLMDPLSEIGVVVAHSSLNVRNRRRGPDISKPIPILPDTGEELLYLSCEDELLLNHTETRQKAPLILAVTINRETATYNLWTVTYVDNESTVKRRSQQKRTASGTLSRRRSSYGHSLGTGTTTPAARSFASARESFGVPVPLIPNASQNSHAGNDSFAEDSLGLQLDPAFENPAVPARSSRRVSSLLARSDLSRSYDQSAFSDMVGGQIGGSSKKRGPSAMNYGPRLATGLRNGSVQPHVPNYDMGSSTNSNTMHQPLSDDLLEELNGSQELNKSTTSKLHEPTRGLRREVIFTKLYTIPISKLDSRISTTNTGTLTKHKIFTVKSRGTSRGNDIGKDYLSMCIFDHVAKELITLQITVTSRFTHRESSPARGMVNRDCFSYDVKVTDMRKGEKIIDACKIQDRKYSRILVLGDSDTDTHVLTLQAPWSTLFKLHLPSKLLVHDPYQIATCVSRNQKREGGFKRVLSQDPRTLVALKHQNTKGCVDVVDYGGTRHRIQIQLRPHHYLVDKIISVCDFVLPVTEADLDMETILRGWWDVLYWLNSRPEEVNDREWTALVVLIFAIGATSVEDRRTQAATRQKRRKSGLLRSGSGADTDLESWDAMQVQEGGLPNVSHNWMQATAWEWTGQREAVDLQSTASRAGAGRISATNVLAANMQKKSSFVVHTVSLARSFVESTAGSFAVGENGYLPSAKGRNPELQRTAFATLLVAIHLLREESKLDNLSNNAVQSLAPVLAQMGHWLGWDSWGTHESSYYMLESAHVEDYLFDASTIQQNDFPDQPFEPPSILKYAEGVHVESNIEPFLSLFDVKGSRSPDGESTEGAENVHSLLMEMTPRTHLVAEILPLNGRISSATQVLKLVSYDADSRIMETLPEGIAVSLRAAVAECQAQPSSVWNMGTMDMIGRDDISMLEKQNPIYRQHGKSLITTTHEALRDVHMICDSTLETETLGAYDGSAETDRQAITRLIFREDQRFAEAAKLLHPLKQPIASCTPEPEWSDTDLLEAQQELVKTIAIRTLSVSSGRGMLFYSARLPLLTEKFPIHGFTLSCVMKPANTTVTADKNAYTEEKVSWAFFHAGVEAGLSISRGASGIDTSWIQFNKPPELSNRHAGFLLALGLSGHLKAIAKWVAFKYLTPKHTMTSIGLLLGLSASYLGTMDTLITRLLSVHVTRMLPPGAAELNLSPLTQTTGIMGIGLLYCNTQHRRMSEIMLSEIENVDQDDISNPMDTLRDEGYRLAAGFALGYINLGKGKDLKGLHDMHLVERLLALAVGTKEVNLVHILDKATAGATVAITLIFMKTHNEALARKIDIPDTLHQFDYVRPDIFLLRTVARHLIMWNDISASHEWLKSQLPVMYQQRSRLTTIRSMNSEDMPFFSIVAGLCFSIGLRFAGTGLEEARDVLCHYMDQFIRICRLPAVNYDGKLTRITIRNCQDAIALAAATVMSGSGDLIIFRRLRSLHGRADAETPYGSHLATHLAIGVLFLGGGTHTFNTSNLAIASLLCAFYPLFPSSVLDNKSHLQAFRHFWAFAAEPRCLVVRDADTHQPILMPITISLTNKSLSSTQHLTAPCILPEIDSVATISTDDFQYWRVTLDLASSPCHLAAFRRHQSIYVRRRAAYDIHSSTLSATLQALNDAQSAHQLGKQIFDWVFSLKAFEGFDRAERALVLPSDAAGTQIYKATRETVVDDRLMLMEDVGSSRADRLWGLRVLFAWLDSGGKGWLEEDVVRELRARITVREMEEQE